jgi:hypothetical protein
MFATHPKVIRLAANACACSSFGTPAAQTCGGRPSDASRRTVHPSAWRTCVAGLLRVGSSKTFLLKFGLTACRYSFLAESAIRASRVVISRSVSAGIVVVLTMKTTSECSAFTTSRQWMNVSSILCALKSRKSL